MIPTMLLAGLLVGLLPRVWPVIGVIAAGIVWAIVLVTGNIISGSGGLLAGFAFGIANAATGAVTSWVIKRAIQMISAR